MCDHRQRSPTVNSLSNMWTCMGSTLTTPYCSTHQKFTNSSTLWPGRDSLRNSVYVLLAPTCTHVVSGVCVWWVCLGVGVCVCVCGGGGGGGGG